MRRTPFAGNIIPTNRLDPIAQNLLKYIPLPNQPGTVNNFFTAATRTDDFKAFLGRIDYNVSDVHKLFFSMRHNDRLENRGNLFNNIATGNFLARTNWGPRSTTSIRSRRLWC